MNHWLECIDIWHRASFGLGDSSSFSNKVPGVANGHTLKGHTVIEQKTWKFGDKNG